MSKPRRSLPCNWPPATDKIARRARRAGEIIHGIRAFAEKREPKLARLAVSELLEHTLTLAGPMLSQHRVCFISNANDGLTLDADCVARLQVLLNLVNNANKGNARWQLRRGPR